MGLCSTKQQKQNAMIIQPQLKQIPPISSKHTKTTSLQTQESVQEYKSKNEGQEIKFTTELQILIHSSKLSKFYCIINLKNEVNQEFFDFITIMQHNFTGKLRTVCTINSNNHQGQKYITQVLNNKLYHPNISQIYEIIHDGNQTHIVKDYCCEGALGSVLTRSGQGIEEQQAINYLVQMIEAMNYLHSKNIIHGLLTINSFYRFDNKKQIKLFDPYFYKKNITYEITQYLAPEIIDNPYDLSIAQDIWAIGIIFYQLLTGNFPFNGQNIVKLKSDIKRGVINLDELHLDKISTRSKSFLTQLLHPNPAIRSNLKLIINSDYYKKIVRNPNIKSKILTKVKQANAIQSLFLQQFINTYCQTQQQEIYQLFNKYDINNDGKLSKGELLQILEDELKSKEQAQKFVNEVFQAIDIDNNGNIDYQEFILSLVDRQAFITEENLKVIFKSIANGQNYITKKSLMNCFQLTQEQTNHLFQLITQTNKIEFLLFKKIMMELL